MDINDIHTVTNQADYLLEVRCRAQFPKHYIQNLGPASIGCFTLTLNTRHEILRATAHVDSASYNYLVIDDSNTLEAFANGCDAKDYIGFDPRTRFRLDPFEEPDLDGDTPWPDTARLVNITNLPTIVASGRLPVESLEPYKGMVHARLEAQWGRDAGVLAWQHPRVQLNDMPLLTEPTRVRRLTYIPTILNIPALRSASTRSYCHIVDTETTPGLEQEAEAVKSIERPVNIHQRIGIKRLASAPLDRRQSSRFLSTVGGKTCVAAQQVQIKASNQCVTGNQGTVVELLDDDISPTSGKRLQFLPPWQLGGPNRFQSSAVHSSDPVKALLASSAHTHGCRKRLECTVCRTTRSRLWLGQNAKGKEVAAILVQINAKLPEDAQSEYGHMFNIERCGVAKKAECDQEQVSEENAAFRDTIRCS